MKKRSMQGPPPTPGSAAPARAAVLLAAAVAVSPVVGFHGPPSAAAAQQGGLELGPEARRFVDEARRAALRFEDRREAVASGYRRLGPDFPGMGVHWVHPGLVVSGDLDASRPPVLCYTEVGGTSRLVGVAYAVPLSSTESPPETPLGPDVWHDHRDEVDEESLLLEHPASHGPRREGYRLAMVHVWTPVANPRGVLAQNNWSLPFLRSGLPVPDSVSSEAARGLSLAGRGPAYYLELFRSAADPTSHELEAARAVLERAGARADHWVEEHRNRGEGEMDLAGLEDVWDSVWRDLGPRVGPGTWARLAPLRR